MNIARRRWLGDVYEHGIVGRGRFALTFDDGPLEGATDAVLDILKSLNAPATFFVIGQWVEQNPALTRRIFDAGHLIGNHTYSHSRLGALRGPWFWRGQIERADTAILNALGRRPRLFRPPFGTRTVFNCSQIARGHACVMWNRRAIDGVFPDTQKILDRLLPSEDGDILLLHDGREPASRRNPQPTIDAIEPLIRGLRAKGLQPAPLDEMLGISAYD